MFNRIKSNKILEYLSRCNICFNKEEFREIVYSEEGFNSLKHNFKGYKFKQSTRKRMLENLRSCKDIDMLHQLIFYTELNDPITIKTSYFTLASILLAVLGLIFSLVPDDYRTALFFIVMSIYILVVFYVIISTGNSLGKVSTYSYLNSLCKQVLAEK